MARKVTAQTWQDAGTDDPPLVWNIKFWPTALKDAKQLLPPQYWHVADQLRELARCKEPARCPTLDIDRISGFWRLAEKGGPLGKTNIRVFFTIEDSDGRKEIVILGVHKKEEEGKLRKSVKTRIERRLRLYRETLAKKGTRL